MLLTNDCKNHSISSLSLSFLLAEVHSKFHFLMRLLAERFRVPKPNVLFIAIDDLNDWVGCLGGHPQTLTQRIWTVWPPPAFFSKMPIVRLPPATLRVRRSLRGFHLTCQGLYRNEQKMRGVMHGCRTVAPNLFQSGVLVRWFGQDAPLLHRRSFLGEYFPREGNGEPFSKDLGATQASG